MSIRANLENIKRIYMSNSSLDLLLDFERVLDQVDLYAFPNWLLGELVEGPIVTKYWVRCKFMWPHSKMPDPRGAKRLLAYGARISYQQAAVDIPVEIKSQNDFRAGSKKGKLVSTPVWYVDMTLPKILLKEVKQGSKEIAGEELDLDDLNKGYEKDMNQNEKQPAANTPSVDDQAVAQGGGDMGMGGMGAAPPMPGGAPNAAG